MNRRPHTRLTQRGHRITGNRQQGRSYGLGDGQGPGHRGQNQLARQTRCRAWAYAMQIQNSEERNR